MSQIQEDTQDWTSNKLNMQNLGNGITNPSVSQLFIRGRGKQLLLFQICTAGNVSLLIAFSLKVKQSFVLGQQDLGKNAQIAMPHKNTVKKTTFDHTFFKTEKAGYKFVQSYLLPHQKQRKKNFYRQR